MTTFFCLHKYTESILLEFLFQLLSILKSLERKTERVLARLEEEGRNGEFVEVVNRGVLLFEFFDLLLGFEIIH